MCKKSCCSSWGSGEKNEEVYGQIGDFFRGRYGKYSGWAHSMMFAAELNIFKEKPTPPPEVKKKRLKKEMDSAAQTSKIQETDGATSTKKETTEESSTNERCSSLRKRRKSTGN